MDEKWMDQLDARLNLMQGQLESMDSKMDQLVAQENVNKTDIAWLKSAGKASVSVLIAIVTLGVPALLKLLKLKSLS